MNKIEVCLSPELIHLFDLKGKIVVVVDILRATSSMVSGFASGVKEIIPVTKVEECKALQAKGYVGGGERNGQKVEGMDIGNSPFSYMDAEMVGKSIAMTTTNGTLAINKSKEADEILIGAFLNIQAVANYLQEAKKDIVVFCAGWKGRVNLEDSLFAGNLISLLKETHKCADDAALMTESMWEVAKDNVKGYLSQCAHAQRLKKLEVDIDKDIDHCLERDLYQIVPYFRDGKIEIDNA